MLYERVGFRPLAGAEQGHLPGSGGETVNLQVDRDSLPPAIRERVDRNLAWMGLELDDDANAAGGPLIGTPASRVEVHVIPTDEELMIARHTLAALRRTNEGAA